MLYKYVILQSPRSSVPQNTPDGIDDINLSAVPRRHTDKRLPSWNRGRGEYSMSGRRNEVFQDPGESGQCLSLFNVPCNSTLMKLS